MISNYFKGIKPDLFRLSFCAHSVRLPLPFSICPGCHKPFICRLKLFNIIRLYNTCLTLKLRYTAFYGFLWHFGNYWTIPAQVKKQTDGIFADFRRFSANMGEYPFLLSDCLKQRNIALYGFLCRCAVCPIVSEYAVRLSGCPAVQYRQGRPIKYYVNLPTCPLEYYVNRSDPQENSWLRSICPARSGSNEVSGCRKSLSDNVRIRMTHI